MEKLKANKTNKQNQVNPGVRCGTLSYKLLVRTSPEVSRTIKFITIGFGFPSKLYGEKLLLKTPHILVIGHG